MPHGRQDPSHATRQEREGWPRCPHLSPTARKRSCVLQPPVEPRSHNRHLPAPTQAISSPPQRLSSPPPPARSLATGEHPRDLPRSGAKCSLLLVDDEPSVLQTLSALLASDFEVLTADSAATAQRIFAAREVDLILTDQKMPG